MTTIENHHRETATSELDVMGLARGMAAFFVGALTLASVLNWAPGVITIPAGAVVGLMARVGVNSDLALRMFGGLAAVAVAGTLATAAGSVIWAAMSRRHA